MEHPPIPEPAARAASPAPPRPAAPGRPGLAGMASAVGNVRMGAILATARTPVTRPSRPTVARVDVLSPEYQRGHDDGRAGTPPHAGPLIDTALADYDEGYRAGEAEAGSAGTSLGPATASPGRSPAGPAANGAAPAPAPVVPVDPLAWVRVTVMLREAGVPDAQQGLPRAAVTVADATRILNLLVSAHPSLVGIGPRMVWARIFGDIVFAGSDTTITAVAQREAPFRSIVFLRPDGYISSAMTGEAIQRAGTPHFADGKLRAGGLETGAFYYSDGGVFYRADDNLGRTGPPIGELALEHDAVNSALDGVADALVGMAAGLAQLIRHPIDTIAALRNLPGAVGQLIENAPEYWELFKAMPLNDQIRAVSKLLTTLLTLYGSAAGTTTRLAAAAGDLGNLTVRALTLSGNGELAWATVSVPVGTTATALSGGPGAVYILHMANTALSPSGGGPAGGGGGGAGGGGGGGRLIVPAGRVLSAEETAMANQLVAEGHTVEALAEGPGRTADFLVDGIRTELKTITNLTSPDPSGALARRILDGAGQGPHIIADVRGQAGMTEELAQRAARRAYGADATNRIQEIRLIGQGFDVRVPRITAPPAP